MPVISLPYGRDFVTADIPNQLFRGELCPELDRYDPSAEETEIVRRAMANPIGSKTLKSLAVGKNKIVIIISDHTRPVPSKIILPLMLSEIRESNPSADITLLVATGCHRAPTKEELAEKLGDILLQEKLVIHDCDNKDALVDVGVLPSGTPLSLNKLAVEADLLLSEGFIEPHFFAGYSGGRKSVLPGIADRISVMGNHCSEFIAHPCARTGILDGNPIHNDMVWGAKRINLAYIVNVVVNSHKRVIHAVAGDFQQAHECGCRFLENLCQICAKPADIVITSNNGYPLDQNIYQAVKGMSTAETLVKAGGVIIMLAESTDGHGSEDFYRVFRDEPDPAFLMDKIIATPRDATIADQWQSQIFARILKHAKIVFVSNADPEMVRQMHMMPAGSIEEALSVANKILGDGIHSVLVVPYGISSVAKTL